MKGIPSGPLFGVLLLSMPMYMEVSLIWCIFSWTGFIWYLRSYMVKIYVILFMHATWLDVSGRNVGIVVDWREVFCRCIGRCYFCVNYVVLVLLKLSWLWILCGSSGSHDIRSCLWMFALHLLRIWHLMCKFGCSNFVLSVNGICSMCDLAIYLLFCYDNINLGKASCNWSLVVLMKVLDWKREAIIISPFMMLMYVSNHCTYLLDVWVTTQNTSKHILQCHLLLNISSFSRPYI